jgi:hypothetical protein
MRYGPTVAALAVAGAVVAAAPGSAVAAAPDRASIDISDSFVDDVLSEACGTEVAVTLTGTAEITLWRNTRGLVVRELDRFPKARVTWTASGTGRTVTTRFDAVSSWDYGSGAVLGGPVTVTAHGLFFRIPGVTSAVAGREVAVGSVDAFDNGIPIVDRAEQVLRVGHDPEFDFVDAMCEALTG